ncbi:MAG: hypothetical protein K1X94_29560 [Sandaracinaceae bacterium]|nr:hypothetical protein [Sandaracinaceae bacterium]
MRALILLVGVAAGMSAGCSQDALPPSEDYTVRMAPEDLTTGLTASVRPTVTLSTYWPWQSPDEFVARELPAWDRSLRLVRWPSQELVAGRWVFSNTYPPSTLTFEPETELAPGWYATQMRFSDLPVTRGTLASAPQVLAGTAGPNVGSTLIEGWTTTRFHVGSRPIALLRGFIATGGEEGGDLHLFVSEEVALAAEQDTSGLLEVTVDGSPLQCPAYARLVPSGPFLGLDWICESPEREGEVVVTLRTLAAAPAGLVYGSAESPPTWRFHTGEFIDPYDVPDALFAPEGGNP